MKNKSRLMNGTIIDFVVLLANISKIQLFFGTISTPGRESKKQD